MQAHRGVVPSILLMVKRVSVAAVLIAMAIAAWAIWIESQSIDTSDSQLTRITQSL